MGNRTKLTDIQIQPDDLNAVLDVSIKSIKLGRPPKFEDSAAGLQDFKEASIAYLEFVRENNNNPDNENKIIPDIENWATFMGTTRKTICEYERWRGENWQEFIGLMKGCIVSCKKQLAFRQKIPTVLAIFDLTNNAGYVNASEFRLLPETDSNKSKTLDSEDIKAMLTKKENMEIEVIETNVSDEFQERMR